MIVSISGIRDTTVSDAAKLAARLDKQQVQYSLLVAPHIGQGWRLSKDADTLDFLRTAKAAGRPIILAGYDQSNIKKRRAEFASLGTHEALLRLTAARRQLAHLDLDTTLFSPPRWVASPGALEAAPQAGMTVLADLGAIHSFDPQLTVAARVLGIGEGFGARKLWRRSVAESVQRILGRGGIARVSIDAKHLADGTRRSEFLSLIESAQRSGTALVDYETVVADQAAVTPPSA